MAKLLCTILCFISNILPDDNLLKAETCCIQWYLLRCVGCLFT